MLLFVEANGDFTARGALMRGLRRGEVVDAPVKVLMVEMGKGFEVAILASSEDVRETTKLFYENYECVLRRQKYFLVGTKTFNRGQLSIFSMLLKFFGFQKIL